MAYFKITFKELKNIKNYKIVLIVVIITCLYSMILTRVLAALGINPYQNKNNYGIVTDIIAAIIVAPVIETFVFQYCPHLILRKINLIKKQQNFRIVYLIISTILFCLSHYYSIAYILAMIFPGLILAYFFNFFYLQMNYKNAIYFTVLIHLLTNTIAVIDEHFLNNLL